MNENIDLTKILKDCPKGTKLYSPLFGEVILKGVCNNIKDYPIRVETTKDEIKMFTDSGKYTSYEDAECMLFPSKEIRNWDEFKVLVKHKEFKPFDKVLVRHVGTWLPDFFAKIEEFEDAIYYRTMIHGINDYEDIIPYKGNENKVGKEV